MIKALLARWNLWKNERRKRRELPGEYEALAREFGLLTAKCLDAGEQLRHGERMYIAMRDRCARVEAELASIEKMLVCDTPGLTPGEIERLAILSEECGEVVRAIGKIQRYGWESASPFVVGGRTNRCALERELGSMRAVVNLMLDSQDIRLNAVQSWQRTKKTALERWTLYQRDSMPRDEQLAMITSIRDNNAN